MENYHILKMVWGHMKHISNNSNFKLSRLICHRIPERSFKIKGKYFPVCARCTGFYLAAFSYFIYVYFVYIEYTFHLIFMAFLMIIPSFLDGFTQFIGTRESKNTLRLITGLSGGLGLAIILKAFKFILIS